MSSSSMNSPAVVYDGAVSRADLEVWESELGSLFSRMHPLFYRTESRKHAQQYVRGLLAPIQRKNGWTIAEYVGESEPSALQRFLNLSPWDADALLDLNREYAMEHLASPAAILVADPTGSRRREPYASSALGSLCRPRDYAEREGGGAGQQWLRHVGGRHNPGL